MLGKCELGDLDRHRQLGQRERLGLGLRQVARLGAASPAGAARRRARRSSRLTDTRPRSSASRLQSSSTLSISSQAPLASEMVTCAIRARDDSAPVTPLRRICRPGEESRFSSRLIRKPLSLPVAGGFLGERGDGHEHEHAEEDEEPLQNACPMPM